MLDRTGSVELLTIADGESILSIDAEDTPIGVAVATDDAGPWLVVADTSSLRGYRSDGEQTF